MENRDAMFYKKPGFCIPEDHDLRDEKNRVFTSLEDWDAIFL